MKECGANAGGSTSNEDCGHLYGGQWLRGVERGAGEILAACSAGSFGAIHPHHGGLTVASARGPLLVNAKLVSLLAWWWTISGMGFFVDVLFRKDLHCSLRLYMA